MASCSIFLHLYTLCKPYASILPVLAITIRGIQVEAALMIEELDSPGSSASICNILLLNVYCSKNSWLCARHWELIVI